MNWEELLGPLPGRTLGVKAFGDDADELELAALEEAEHAFGPGVPLGVVPCYHMYWLGLDEIEITGKRYGAYIHVLAPAVAPLPGPGENG